MAEHGGAPNLLGWAPLLLTLVGWFIVNQQANKRETRKEKRSAADRCKKLTHDVATMGVEYWTGESESNAWRIRASLEELELELTQFPLYRNQSPLIARFNRLVDAITGGKFETKSRTAVDLNDSIVTSIRQSRTELIREIERQFQVHYC